MNVFFVLLSKAANFALVLPNMQNCLNLSFWAKTYGYFWAVNTVNVTCKMFRPESTVQVTDMTVYMAQREYGFICLKRNVI